MLDYDVPMEEQMKEESTYNDLLSVLMHVAKEHEMELGLYKINDEEVFGFFYNNYADYEFANDVFEPIRIFDKVL